MYKLQSNSVMTGDPSTIVLRTTDGAYIPFDHANTDYQQYLEWLAEGNEPEAADV